MFDVFPQVEPVSSCESGAKAAALQTLRDCLTSAIRAKRLECGGFSAAFGSPTAIASSNDWPQVLKLPFSMAQKLFRFVFANGIGMFGADIPT
jgi:hypothetical protein